MSGVELYTGLSLLGGLLALDQTSLGQTMVSRPLVAGAAAGWLLGEPVTGLAAGGVLEAFVLSAFPVGGARYPETGPAGVVAAAGAISVGGPAGLPLGVALGLAWAFLGEASIHVMRRRNATVAPEGPSDGMAPRVLIVAHLRGLAVDFLRGTTLTAVGLVAASRGLALLAPAWPLDEGGTGVVLGIGGALTLGGLTSCYAVRRWRIAALLVGLAAGGAVGALL